MPRQSLRETIRVQSGRVPLLSRHLARLAAGGCGADVLTLAREQALAAAAAWPGDYGRMTLLVEADGSVHVEVSDRPSTIDVPGGPRAALVYSAIPKLPPGAAKPADRSFWDRALHEAQGQGADVAILLDDESNIIDGSQASVWVVTGGELVTPPSPPALAGVSRALVLDLGTVGGMRVVERPVSAQEFESADEAFFTTAVAGAVGVRGRGGRITREVAAAFDRAFETI